MLVANFSYPIAFKWEALQGVETTRCIGSQRADRIPIAGWKFTSILEIGEKSADSFQKERILGKNLEGARHFS